MKIETEKTILLVCMFICIIFLGISLQLKVAKEVIALSVKDECLK